MSDLPDGSVNDLLDSELLLRVMRPLFSCDHIRNPFWRGFMEVFTHAIWALPLGFLIGVYLR